MERKSAFCFQLWEGTLVLLLMEIVCPENTVQWSSQNKLSILLHFRIGKHSPSCLGKERSVESQLLCCSHFPFAVATFHQQISYHFGISSMQHKEHRIFFPLHCVVPRVILKLMDKERNTSRLFWLTVFTSLVKASGTCWKLRVTVLPSMAPWTLWISLWSPYLAFIEFFIIFC